MSRLIEWSEYLTNEFGLTTRFVDTQSDDWARVRYRMIGAVEPLGVYMTGEGLALLQSSLWGKAKGFEVLIHEFGHHLVWEDHLSYKGNAFVAEYFRKVDRPWLLSYSPWKREEEIIVQCLALWATDWGDQHEVNKGFKDFLISLGASPPPF